MSSSLVRSIYRALLRSASTLRHRERALKIRERPSAEVRGVLVAHVPDAEGARREALLACLPPGLLPHTLPAELSFDYASLSACIRDNFRANQALPRGSAAAEQAVDSALAAVRFLSQQASLDECSNSVSVRNVELEGTSCFEAKDSSGEELPDGGSYEDGQEAFRFAYRLSIRNTGTSKLRFGGVKYTIHDEQGNASANAHLQAMTAKGERPPIGSGYHSLLLPGEALELTHLAYLPTAEGLVSGTATLQRVRAGRYPDRMRLELPPFRLQAPRALRRKPRQDEAESKGAA
mmetsp:Transcript_4400/g.10983  ORF Transcript_4400/g.10983 Transcript_4400/m.10983 type:complete len:292 (-) Transcript_4400:83-958(-)